MESNNTPLISVVMPSYNGSEYIHAAIFSVLGQKYPNLELIVVDDGSTDTTQEIVSAIQEKDKRVKSIMNGVNQGTAKARNKGMEVARGEYIAVLDVDDLWVDPYKTQKQVDFFQQNSDVGFLGTNNIVRKVQSERTLFSSSERFVSDEHIKASLLAYNPFCHSTVMYRNMYDKIGGYPEHILHADDYAYRLKVGTYTKFANLVDYTTLYTSHANNTSNTHKRAQKLESLKLSWEHRYEYPHASKCLPQKIYTTMYALVGEYMDNYCPFLKEEIRRLLGKTPRYVHSNHVEFLEGILAVENE